MKILHSLLGLKAGYKHYILLGDTHIYTSGKIHSTSASYTLICTQICILIKSRGLVKAQILILLVWSGGEARAAGVWSRGEARV